MRFHEDNFIVIQNSLEARKQKFVDMILLELVNNKYIKETTKGILMNNKCVGEQVEFGNSGRWIKVDQLFSTMDFENVCVIISIMNDIGFNLIVAF